MNNYSDPSFHCRFILPLYSYNCASISLPLFKVDRCTLHNNFRRNYPRSFNVVRTIDFSPSECYKIETLLKNDEQMFANIVQTAFQNIYVLHFTDCDTFKLDSNYFVQ